MCIVVSWRHSKCLNFINQIFLDLLLRHEVLLFGWWPFFLTNNNPLSNLMTNWIGNSLICNFGWINENMILDQINLGLIFFLNHVYKNPYIKWVDDKWNTSAVGRTNNQTFILGPTHEWRCAYAIFEGTSIRREINS